MDSMAAGLAPLDWAVVGLYLVAIVGFGLYASRGSKGASGYFLASRSISWPFIGLALLASNISSTTLVGLAGSAYGSGISVYNYEWMAAVVLVFFCIFFLPFLLRSQVYTLPEFLERRYDGRARTYFSALTIFLNIVVDTAATLYGGALMFKLVFPHVDLIWIVAALALSAGIYTIAGGLVAVILTETVQAVILLAASVFITFYAFDAAGGWDKVMSTVDPAKLSLIRPIDTPESAGVPWLGLILGVPLLGFYFWCTNQFMVQRVLAAKDENHGRWGALFAGLLKLPILFFMVLPGTAAILIYPSLDKPDTVYPRLVFDLLPPGLVGLVVAGFLAALMSSIASTFNSASTLVTMDFVRRWRPGMKDADLVRTGRIATIIFMGLAVLWAPMIQNFQSLWTYLQSILAYASPPVVALFVIGLFWRGANAAGAIAAIVTGVAAAAYLFWSIVITRQFELHFLYVAPILFAISGAALIVGSWLVPNAKRGGDELQWTPKFYQAETQMLAGKPLLKNYRFLSLLLLALTAVLVFWFR